MRLLKLQKGLFKQSYLNLKVSVSVKVLFIVKSAAHTFKEYDNIIISVINFVFMCFIRSFHLYDCKISEKTFNNTCSLMGLWAHAPFQVLLQIHNNHINFWFQCECTVFKCTSYLNTGTLGTITSPYFILTDMLQCCPQGTVVSYLSTYHLGNLALLSNKCSGWANRRIYLIFFNDYCHQRVYAKGNTDKVMYQRLWQS